MNQLNVEDVRELGRVVGLYIDGTSAETIASRLSGIIAELDDIPEELLASVEPSHVFSLEED